MFSFEVEAGYGWAKAQIKDHVIATGGSDAPSPFDLFLVSLANCAAQTATGYCQAHGLPTEGMKLLVEMERDQETRLAAEIKMQLVLPAGFPEERKAAVVKAAESCFVKRHLYAPPKFETTIAE